MTTHQLETATGDGVLDYLLAHVVDLPSRIDRIRAVLEEIGHPGTLSLQQALYLHAACLDRRPDVIIELGRGIGNSTAVFVLAAAEVADCRIESFDRHNHWETRTLPKVERAFEAEALDRLTSHVADIGMFDFESALAGRSRVLVFWDAHGYVVSDAVLGRLLPALVRCEHVVLCHDMQDNRLWSDGQFGYEGLQTWRGMDHWYANKETTARVCLGWVTGIVDQIVPVVDFCARNGIELHSPGHAFAELVRQRPSGAEALRALLPEFGRSLPVWFSINEATRPLTFPGVFPVQESATTSG